MGYCTNYDVWWKNSNQDRATGDYIRDSNAVTEISSNHEEFRGAACFSEIWRSIPNISRIRVYLCIQYPGKDSYGEDYSDDANLDFSQPEIERYVRFLNGLKLKCTLEPEMFNINIKGNNVEAYGVMVEASEMSPFAVLVALNALRYLYEYSDGHQEFAKAILAFDKDRTALCSKWNKFAIAHYVTTKFNSDHCLRPYSSYMAMLGDPEIESMFSERAKCKVEEQMPIAPKELSRRNGTQSPVVALWQDNKPLRDILPAYRKMAYGV